jgi:hypothetical protein
MEWPSQCGLRRSDLRGSHSGPKDVSKKGVADVRLGSKTVLMPLKWDFCFTPESRHRSATLPIRDLIACYGGAKLTYKRLASKVHCID